MFDINKEVNKVVAAMLTLAWASTQKEPKWDSAIIERYESFKKKV